MRGGKEIPKRKKGRAKQGIGVNYLHVCVKKLNNFKRQRPNNNFVVIL